MAASRSQPASCCVCSVTHCSRPLEIAARDGERVAAGRVLVHSAGGGFEIAVDLDDLAGNRRVDFARGLHALDDRGFIALCKRLADARQLDEDDIAELALSVIRNADDAGIALDADVFVILGVAGGHELAFRT